MSTSAPAPRASAEAHAGFTVDHAKEAAAAPGAPVLSRSRSALIPAGRAATIEFPGCRAGQRVYRSPRRAIQGMPLGDLMTRPRAVVARHGASRAACLRGSKMVSLVMSLRDAITSPCSFGCSRRRIGALSYASRPVEIGDADIQARGFTAPTARPMSLC